MSARGIKETISGMTFKQKADYLWTYYKWVLVIVILVILLISIVCTSITNSQVETLYSGVLVNVSASDEGMAYLSDQWLVELCTDVKKQKVDLSTTTFQDLETTSNPQLDAAAAMKVTVRVAAQEIDYVIMDDIGFDYYKNHHVFSSLENVLPAELLNQVKDLIIYYEDEENGSIPIAIDISQSEFVKDCIQRKERVYIAFPGNTDRTERNGKFLEYLLNWR